MIVGRAVPLSRAVPIMIFSSAVPVSRAVPDFSGPRLATNCRLSIASLGAQGHVDLCERMPCHQLR